MKYYIEVPKELVEASNLKKDRYEVGEKSFDNFYVKRGLNLLQDFAERFPEVLEFIVLKDSKGEEHEISEFLKEVEDLNIWAQ